MNASLPQKNLSRRTLIAAIAVAGGGVAFGVQPLLAQEAKPAKKDFGPGGPAEAFKYWLKVDADSSITVGVHMAEMGQGIATSLPQLVAEELGVDWHAVRFVFPRNGEVYYNRGYASLQRQEGTGGSNSIRAHYVMFREIGATAREMFKTAAAAQWKVPVSEIVVDGGRVMHARTNRSETLGAMAALAAQQTPPDDVQLKAKSEWKLIGQGVKRLDTPAKVDGTARFGADVILPGMQVATIQQCPVFGGKLKAVDHAPALAVKGVTKVVTMDNAVAVVADGYWNALKGLKTLKPDWDYGTRAHYGVAEMNADLDKALNTPDAPELLAKGDVDGTLKTAVKKASFEMQAPYLAHACMEPMNATAHVQDGKVEVWAPTQGATLIVNGIASALNVDPATIRVNRTFLGGGFGRRSDGEYAVQAAVIAKAAGTPVKLIWSREEDIRQDVYRPVSKVRMTAALDERGVVQAWDILNASPSITKRRFPEMVKDNKDPSHLAGFVDHPYNIKAMRVRSRIVDNGIPVGFWRSVYHGQNIYFRESMLNELAEKAGIDPIAYRRLMLEGNARFLAMLDDLVKLSEYDKPLATTKAGYKRGRGFAIGNSHGSLCAQVADVTVAPDNSFVVDRFSCVIDVGTIINPKIVEAQMESSIIDGLGMTMFGGMTPKDGGMAEGNFSEVRFLRLVESPLEIRVKVKDWPDTPPGGVGEPALPPTAPALIDALAKATGTRLQALPVSKQGFSV
ncbi:MAG: xanthine dehydrogenase family protein molybdopterin-binding subunit [Rhodospirillaceae bacterium]|nr:xanthine dehydrogenase family protein molybdopterin-binding subunit [Rhodospirillaceae bacterium]